MLDMLAPWEVLDACRRRAGRRRGADDLRGHRHAAVADGGGAARAAVLDRAAGLGDACSAAGTSSAWPCGHSTRMRGHTAFLISARKLAPGAVTPTPLRRKRQLVAAASDCRLDQSSCRSRRFLGNPGPLFLVPGGVCSAMGSATVFTIRAPRSTRRQRPAPCRRTCGSARDSVESSGGPSGVIRRPELIVDLDRPVNATRTFAHGGYKRSRRGRVDGDQAGCRQADGEVPDSARGHRRDGGPSQSRQVRRAPSATSCRCSLSEAPKLSWRR